MRTLILGGARSGKSAFAERMVGDADCLYVATARPWPGDTDFSERIAQHVARRPQHWRTEEQRDVMDVLSNPPQVTVLIDDLGTWLTNLFDRYDYWNQPRHNQQAHVKITALIDAIADVPTSTDLIIVSPEVGMGIIPEHRSGRLFRDQIGSLNAAVAEVCDQVILVIAGQSLILKHAQPR